MTNTLKNRAVCILGMHRSGTSAVARAINLMGVYLGEPEQLMPSTSDNQKGYWEHTGIFDIHERILSVISRTWNDIWPMPDAWWKYPEIQPLREELLSLLRRDFSDKPLWGWKDPRTCLMLPLWHEILNELDVQSNYIIIVRNPLDVAASLWKRDNLLLSESYRLWQLYTLSALMETNGSKRIVIQYDNFLESWKSCIGKVTKSLEIPFLTDESSIYNEMKAFIDPNLRHSRSTLYTLENNLEIPESILTTYRLCLDAEMQIDFLNCKEFSEKVYKLYLDYTTYTNTPSTDLKAALINKNKLIQQQNDLIRQKDELIRFKAAQISAMFNTWSWKITAPLRQFGHILMKLKILNKNKEIK